VTAVLLPGAVSAGLLAALAVLVVPRRGARGEQRLHLRASPPRRPGSAHPAPGRGRADDTLAVAVLAELVAAVARAGLSPARTWRLVSERSGPFATTAVAASLWAEAGLPAGAALVRASPGGPGHAVVALSVALDVCDRAGAPTADVLDGLARSLRAQEAARQDREVALAAPRATGTVMSVLPVAGLALGALLGADPLAVLLATAPGRVCLVAGAGLWSAGRWWTGRLVAAATGPW
jgi:tight adherence protein B